MAGFMRSTGKRGIHEAIKIILPHEALLRTLKGIDVEKALEAWEKPLAYQENAVVCREQGKGGRCVVPYSLFMDGVEYSNSDSMLVVSLTNLLNNEVVVLACIRKRLLCGSKTGCGCQHYCSLYHLFKTLNWSMRALAFGEHPTERSCLQLCPELLLDSGCWRFADMWLEEVAGQSMSVCGCCLELRTDWSELASGLGVCQWNHRDFPCPLCTDTKDNMYTLLGNKDAPRTLKKEGGYEEEVVTAEVAVALSDASWSMVKSCLKQDARKKGNHGLVLGFPLPGLGLAKHDRLEPCHECQDYSVLHAMNPGSAKF
eukprot:6472156-Amphidinium_carterae.1